MWAMWVLVGMSGLAAGYLVGWGTGSPRCAVCGRALPRICPGALCAGRPGFDEDAENRLQSDRDVDAVAKEAYAAGYVDGLIAARDGEEGEGR